MIAILLLWLYKTQQSLIISNKMAAVEASACTSLTHVDENPTSHRKVVLNNTKIFVSYAWIDFACWNPLKSSIGKDFIAELLTISIKSPCNSSKIFNRVLEWVVYVRYHSNSLKSSFREMLRNVLKEILEHVIFLTIECEKSSYFYMTALKALMLLWEAMMWWLYSYFFMFK